MMITSSIFFPSGMPGTAFAFALKASMRLFTPLLVLFMPVVLHAQLVVKVDVPKTAGSKAVIKLTMKNAFAEKVQSSRATIFLHDSEGKVVAQETRWVIGGSKENVPLPSNASTTFNFVITTDKQFTKAKVIFNRVVLEGGRTAGPNAVEVSQ